MAFCELLAGVRDLQRTARDGRKWVRRGRQSIVAPVLAEIVKMSPAQIGERALGESVPEDGA